MTRKDISAIMQRFVNESYQILQKNGLNVKKEKYKAILTSYFWAIYFGKPMRDKAKKIHRSTKEVFYCVVQEIRRDESE